MSKRLKIDRVAELLEGVDCNFVTLFDIAHHARGEADVADFRWVAANMQEVLTDARAEVKRLTLEVDRLKGGA